MPSKPKTYRKLAGNTFSAALRNSLWLGPDHLMWVESAVFQERYRRFYFQDIEAVVLIRTGRRTAWTLTLGVLFLFFTVLVVFSMGRNYFSIFMMTLLAVLTALQWLKGPGCKVYLQTAVQKYHLSNLVRTRKALKVMDRIRASAEAAQGPLDEQESARTGVTGMPAETEKEKTTKDSAPFGIRLHGIQYGLLFFFGLVRSGQLWFRSVPLAVADMVFLACTLVLTIAVLARMRGRGRGSLLSISAWLTLVFAVIHTMAAYGVFMAAMIRAMPSMAMEQEYNNWTLIKNFFWLQVESHPAVTAIAVGAALVSIGLGVLGLIAVIAEKRDRRISVQ